MILYNPTVSGSLLVTGSLTTTGTLTAQTLVVQTITSSVDFVTGSSVNGSLSSNTHQFTGSVLMSGSLTVSSAATFSSSVTITGTGLNSSLRLTNTTATTGVDWHLYSLNNGNLGIYNNTSGAYALQFASTGNVGVGVNPSAGWVQGKALEVGFAGNGIWGRYADEVHLTNNYYFSTATSSRLYASTAGASDYEQFNGAHIWYTAPSGTAGTAVTFTERMKITSAGVLELTSGQLKFPASQNASSDANTLDDYEEGTWTPVIGGLTSQSGQTYAGQTGHYTKIGRLVTATFRVQLSNKGTITGDVVIKGLPFTVQNSISFGSGVTYWVNLSTAWNYIYLAPIANDTSALVEGIKSAASVTIRAATADIASDSQFNGTITYFV